MSAPRIIQALAQAIRYIEVVTAYKGAMTAEQVEAAIKSEFFPSEVSIGAHSANTLARFDFTEARAALAAEQKAEPVFALNGGLLSSQITSSHGPQEQAAEPKVFKWWVKGHGTFDDKKIAEAWAKEEGVEVIPLITLPDHREAMEAGLGTNDQRMGFFFYQEGASALERFAELVAAAAKPEPVGERAELIREYRETMPEGALRLWAKEAAALLSADAKPARDKVDAAIEKYWGPLADKDVLTQQQIAEAVAADANPVKETDEKLSQDDVAGGLVKAQPAEQAKGQVAVPFGTFVERNDGTTEFRRTGEAHSPTAHGYKFWTLYTTPPAQPAREWVGLSGGDFLKLHDEFGIIPDTARVIEKLLREKNAGQPIIHKDEDLLRERFHAWARAQGFDDRVLVKPRTTYTGSHLQMLWEAWLACASTTRNQHEQENDHTEGGSPPA